MDAFLANLSKTVESSILAALSGKLNEFATHVVELPEMKEKGITREQVLECWNSVSDLKINPAAPLAAVGGGGATPSAAKPRAKTDKNKKCPVPKQRGDNAGQPCGRNCVVGEDFCPTHLTKNTKSATPVTGTAPAEEKKEAAPLTVAPPPASSAAGGCQHIMQGGKRPGAPCGAKVTKTTADGSWCTTHGKKH